MKTMLTRACMIALVVAIPLDAQSSGRAFRPEDWYRIARVGGGTLSPDGNTLAFTVTTVLEEKNARHTEVWIQPLSVAYVSHQGLPMGRQGRPFAAWYGDMDLIPHLSEIGKRGAIDVVMTWGEPVAYNGATDRKALAKSLESSVRSLTVAALRGRPAEPPLSA